MNPKQNFKNHNELQERIKNHEKENNHFFKKECERE